MPAKHQKTLDTVHFLHFEDRAAAAKHRPRAAPHGIRAHAAPYVARAHVTRAPPAPQPAIESIAHVVATA